jgi:4-carboxymuconolactone decarboxylase
MARLGIPDDDRLSDEQRLVCAEVVAGKRGKVPAPMIAWLRNPELARRGQRLGELLRYDTALPARLTELAILVCARHWTSHHEWTAHRVLALAAGLEPEAIVAVAAGAEPAFADRPATIVHRVSRAVLDEGRLSPPLYGQAIKVLGERALVELVAVLGYYCMVSLTLNVFELGLPDNVAAELNDPAMASQPAA